MSTEKNMNLFTSALWTAMRNSDHGWANKLIYWGANVREPTCTESNPLTTLLHCAARRGDIQGMRLLIHHGANLEARDTMNQTPLHWAVKTGDHPRVVEVLINKGAVVDARDIQQRTPLYCAVIVGHIESAQKLIARGASIDAISVHGLSVLHVAIRSCKVQIVQMLIRYGVNIDPKPNGFTPLHLCFGSWKVNTEIVQLLLENGADVNAKSLERHYFPLYLAARQNCLASLHLLLKWGARVNETINTGATALHMACRTGLADVAALLLKFGADLNARDQEGKTPFELLPNNPFCEATARVVIREAVKREVLGQPLCEGYKQMVQSSEDYSQFDRECREEFMLMQIEKIDIEDSITSFFYIFSMDEEKLARLARNEKIVTAFESSGYMASFGIYAGDLTTKFEVAKKRANFLMSVEDFLVDVFGDMLPALIVRKIAPYVKSGDVIENKL